ncbi:MAG TPA: glutathione S-transferase family protein [Burkholderiales bacterium]|nr:glutathione S-transferase family protein [Burkholderiales bacterium]
MKLYGYRNGRTLRALWALEEIGAPYEFVEVDLKRGEHRQPEFLALNPAGKVPVLDDGGTIVTESTAICMHLAERHPDSRLLPPAGTPERTECYRWTSFILTELDAPLWTIAKHRFALPQERRVPAVIETSSWEFRTAASILASALDDREYLAGNAFSVADILAGHTLLWAKSARVPLGSDFPEAYLERLMARESFAKARAAAKEPA